MRPPCSSHSGEAETKGPIQIMIIYSRIGLSMYYAIEVWETTSLSTLH